MNVLVVATYDSFLKTGYSIAKRIDGAIVNVFIHQVRANQISISQLDEYGISKNNVQVGSVDSFIAEDYLDSYDLVILSVGNSLFRKCLKKIHRYSNNRLIIIGCFPGVVFGNIESITSRINSDILLCNSYLDTMLAKKIAEFSDSSVDVLHYGLVNLKVDFIRKSHKLKNIYFIDQVKIPDQLSDRIYILQKLINLSNKYPDYNFIIKSRVKEGDQTVHVNAMDYADLLERFPYVPKNLFIQYECMDESYNKMDMCISVSSTVILEALFYKIPSYAISDFGIDTKFANDSFLGSGLFVSFAEMEERLEFYFQLQYSEQWYEDNINVSQLNDRDFMLNNSINYKYNYAVAQKKGRLFSRIAPELTIKRSFLERTQRKVFKLFRNPKQFFIDSHYYTLFMKK